MRVDDETQELSITGGLTSTMLGAVVGDVSAGGVQHTPSNHSSNQTLWLIRQRHSHQRMTFVLIKRKKKRESERLEGGLQSGLIYGLRRSAEGFT